MHVGRGREHPLHIEYVHIGVCLAFIQDIMTEALLNHPRIKMDKKIALVRALGKVIWIQNDLFAKWYVRDGDEFAAEMEAPEVEPEGYLDGKKILEDIDEGTEIAAKSLPTSPKSPKASTCPFSGIPIRPKETAASPEKEKTEKTEKTVVGVEEPVPATPVVEKEKCGDKENCDGACNTTW